MQFLRPPRHRQRLGHSLSETLVPATRAGYQRHTQRSNRRSRTRTQKLTCAPIATISKSGFGGIQCDKSFGCTSFNIIRFNACFYPRWTMTRKLWQKLCRVWCIFAVIPSFLQTRWRLSDIAFKSIVATILRMVFTHQKTLLKIKWCSLTGRAFPTFHVPMNMEIFCSGSAMPTTTWIYTWTRKKEGKRQLRQAESRQAYSLHSGARGIVVYNNNRRKEVQILWSKRKSRITQDYDIFSTVEQEKHYPTKKIMITKTYFSPAPAFSESHLSHKGHTIWQLCSSPLR